MGDFHPGRESAKKDKNKERRRRRDKEKKEREEERERKQGEKESRKEREKKARWKVRGRKSNRHRREERGIMIFYISYRMHKRQVRLLASQKLGCQFSYVPILMGFPTVQPP